MPQYADTAPLPDSTVSFRFPQLSQRLPTGRLHALADIEQTRSAAWCRQHLRCLLPDDDAIDDYIAEQVDLIGLYCYPDARPDRIGTICDVMHFVGALDNVLDNIRADDRLTSATHAMLQPVLDGLRKGSAEAGDPAFLRELGDLLRCVRQGLSEGQWERSLAGLNEYAEGCAAEDRLRAAGTITDLDALIDVRVGVSMGGLVTILIEYGLDVDIGDELCTTPTLGAASTTAIRYVMLLNDLFSYRKEYFHGDISMSPITLLLADGYTLQQAVDRLCDFIFRAENDLYTAIGAVLAAPVGSRPHIRTYLHALETFCAGYLRSCYVAGRYNGRGPVWNGVTFGTMVLHPDHTEYLP